MRPPSRSLIIALPLLALAACGGGSTSPLTDGTPADRTEIEETAGPTASEGEGATGPAAVEMVDFSFSPASITVPAGTEVTWTNQDDTAHTVTAGTPDAGEPDRFDLEAAGAGDTVSMTFDEPGEHPYYCEFHPSMTGTVEVTEP